MRRTVYVTVLAAAAAATTTLVGWLIGRLSAPVTQPAAAAVASTHTGPTVEQVRELAELVTLRVDVADVQTTTVTGHVGGLQVALVVKGDFTLGVDLTAARFAAVDETGRTAVLVLPAPRAASPRVDHDRTRVVAMTDEGLWAVVPGDGGARGRVIDLSYAEAQRTVATMADDPALIERARRRAELVITAFFRAMGWTVRVNWQS